MSYQNFDLRFERSDDGFRVNLNSPEGQTSLEAFRVPESLRQGVPTGDGAQREHGRELYSALFRDDLRDVWERCAGRVGDDGSCRRRIRLHLDPTRERHQELANLPWELLHDGKDFICLQRLTTLVRFIDEPVRMEPLAFEPPLRLFVAKPDVKGVANLTDEERETVGKGWKEKGDGQVIAPVGSAAHRLRFQLLDSQAHVLHFIGHGDFDPASGEGYLLFAGRGWTGAKVTGEDLARIARDLPTLRLVVLNACHTAKHRTGRPAAAFSGVAAALSRSGVAAVVAMQFEVRDSLASVFAETLYEHLAAGDSVEEAVAEGRIAVHKEAPGDLEWLAPVLFLRAEDGRLFEPVGDAAADTSPAEARSVVVIRDSEFELEGGEIIGREGDPGDGPRRTELSGNRIKGSNVRVVAEAITRNGK